MEMEIRGAQVVGIYNTILKECQKKMTQKRKEYRVNDQIKFPVQQNNIFTNRKRDSQTKSLGWFLDK